MSKQYPFTDEEIKAIAQLKRAFTKCDKLGLKFSGMDTSLLVANERAIDEAKRNRSDHNADYNEVAYAHDQGYSGTDCILDGGAYVDSGGW